MMKYRPIEMLATFINPTIYDVRRQLFPLPKLPHILCSHWISSLDNVMMAYIQGERCSYISHIGTNCNNVVFMTVCIYIYIYCSWLYVCIYIDIYTVQLCIMHVRSSLGTFAILRNTNSPVITVLLSVCVPICPYGTTRLTLGGIS